VASTKDRILNVTAELFRRYGYTRHGHETNRRERQCPLRVALSLFPGGKEQLAKEASQRSGRLYFDIWETILDAAPDAVSGMSDFFLGAAEMLRETDYADACPVATVALEVASCSEPLRRATANVFDSWITGITARLVEAGGTSTEVRELAIFAIAALEGAFVLSRACAASSRST